MFSDYLIAQGGTSVLTEVPEMFGAETILMNRCRTTELFNQTVSLINDFKEYFLSHGEPVGENPSPGNKAGGISTLEEKALGCTQKCGKSYVSGVMAYGERLQTKGLNLLSHRAVHYRTRYAIRYFRAYHEDFYQLQPGGTQARLD